MRKRKAKRIVYYVSFNKRLGVWLVMHGKTELPDHFRAQDRAVFFARRKAKPLWLATRTPTQIMVRAKKTGRWRLEYSYGCESKAKG